MRHAGRVVCHGLLSAQPTGERGRGVCVGVFRELWRHFVRPLASPCAPSRASLARFLRKPSTQSRPLAGSRMPCATLAEPDSEPQLSLIVHAICRFTTCHPHPWDGHGCSVPAPVVPAGGQTGPVSVSLLAPGKVAGSGWSAVMEPSHTPLTPLNYNDDDNRKTDY